MKEKKINKNKILTWVLIPLTFIIAVLGGYFLRYFVEGKNVRVATELIRIMEKVGYVYDEETNQLRAITPEDVGDALVNGILDDYAEYYTQAEYEIEQRERSGKFQGLGIVFYNSDNVIDNVVGNSPAYNSGILSGDKILSIKLATNSKVIIEEEEDMHHALKDAKKGDLIVFDIERNGVQLEPISTVYNVYLASYVGYSDSEISLDFKTGANNKLEKNESSSKMPWLDGSTAYVSLSSFNGWAYSQMKEVLNFMGQRGRTKLVLDIRNNGGGYMDILTDIASLLIDNDGKSNSVVAYEKNKKSTIAHSTTENRWVGHITSMSIIANGRTASASECLIGALASYGEIFSLDNLVIDKSYNGKQTTYGKGIMQTTYILANGGALKLTTAQVLWPNKERTCIHGKGISALAENVIDGELSVQRAVEVLD